MHKFEEPFKTIDDLMNLPGDSKAELIDGEIYMMAPASIKHSSVSGNLFFQLRTLLSQRKTKGPTDQDSWVILSEAWTFYGEYDSFVHDLAAFSKKDLPSLPDIGPIIAKPMWVCEIVSPSNWSNDTQRKRVVLEKHGIPYYWLVDPRRKTLQIFKLKQAGEPYQIIYSLENADGIVRIPPFEDLELDLMQVFSY
jgi:Uma2 family endonuclease